MTDANRRLIGPRTLIDAGGILPFAGCIRFQRRPANLPRRLLLRPKAPKQASAPARILGRPFEAVAFGRWPAQALREALSVRPQTAADGHKQGQTDECEQDAREQAVRRALAA